MIQGITSLLLFTFLIFSLCLLRAWFRPAKELHPFLSGVRAWSKRERRNIFFCSIMFCQVMKWLLKPCCLALLSEQLSTPWESKTKAAFSVTSLTFFPQLPSGRQDQSSEGESSIFSHDIYKDVHGILNTMQEVSNRGFHSFPLNTT